MYVVNSDAGTFAEFPLGAVAEKSAEIAKMMEGMKDSGQSEKMAEMRHGMRGKREEASLTDRIPLPATDAPSRYRPRYGRKNRRKWCRGVIGVEHDPAWQTHRSWWYPNKPKAERYVCTTCGKVLDYRK